MATVLYRLGRFSYRRRKLVTGVAVLLLILLATAAVGLGGSTKDAFSIPGTESQRALDALQTDFPAASGATGTVVVQAPAGSTLDDPSVQAAVGTIVSAAGSLPEALGATDPYTTGSVSQSRTIALISVQFSANAETLAEPTIAAFEGLTDLGPAGLEVVPGGSIIGGTTPGAGIGEALGVALAAVILVITFGSLVAAGMTLLIALIGVGAGMAGLFAITAFVDVSSTAPILALMLGLAVGIDYALFISSRHRSNLSHGMQMEESIGRAVATAGSAVLFAGATVVIALAGLSLVGVPFLAAMGLAAAGTVLTAVVVALTVLPAALGFVGRRVLPRALRTASTQVGRNPAAETAEETRRLQQRFGYRWARGVLKFRVPVVVAGILGLAVLSVPVLDLRLALPDNGTAEAGSDARLAYDLTAEGFGPGFNSPLLVVVKAASTADTAALTEQVTVAAGQLADVAAVAPGAVNAAGTTQLVTVIPSSGPTTEATSDLVNRLRTAVQPLTSDTADVGVTGPTAIGVDVSDKLTTALPKYLIVVVGLSFLLLLLAFRSILVPLKATLGFLLTIGATFGTTVAVFQWGWAASLLGVDQAAPLVSFLPIIMLGILFGLAMDYEVFIVSRVREEFTHGKTADEATVEGVGHGARVVTAAALIMAAVFSGFMLTPDPIIKTIGFGLALGVLIDAFVVRMTLVPAVLSLLGSRAWAIPGWLDRVLPRVDIEGESLPAVLAAAAEPESQLVLPRV